MADEETTEIEEWLGNTLDGLLTDPIEIAMNIHSVRKGRRPYVRKVVEEAIKIIAERAERDMQ